MGVPTITGLPPDPTYEELVNKVNYLVNELRNLLLTLDSNNAIEFGGWLIDLDQMVSRDGDVGMSTADTAADDIRFFAGATGGNKDTALYKVRKSGKLEATGAMIQSASGYPKFLADPSGNIIGIYSDADTYMAFLPNASNVPTLVMVDAGTTKAFMNRTPAGGTSFGTFDSEPLNLQPSGALQIEGTNGISGTFRYVKDVVSGVNTYGNIIVQKGIVTNIT